jgi:type III secretory pathway component EscT
MPPGFVPVATITGDGVRPEAITFVCRMLNGAVVLAFQAAAPMGLALLVAGFVMAFLARGQGRSLSGMAWPLRWVLAVVLFVACLPGLVALLQSSWRACAHDITTLSHQ